MHLFYLKTNSDQDREKVISDTVKGVRENTNSLFSNIQIREEVDGKDEILFHSYYANEVEFSDTGTNFGIGLARLVVCFIFRRCPRGSCFN